MCHCTPEGHRNMRLFQRVIHLRVRHGIRHVDESTQRVGVNAVTYTVRLEGEHDAGRSNPAMPRGDITRCIKSGLHPVQRYRPVSPLLDVFFTRPGELYRHIQSGIHLPGNQHRELHKVLHHAAPAKAATQMHLVKLHIDLGNT